MLIGSLVGQALVLLALLLGLAFVGLALCVLVLLWLALRSEWDG